MTAHVAFVIASLGCGGAERVASTLAGHWAARGHRVSVLTLEDEGTAPFYPLHEDVQHLRLGLESEVRSTWRAVMKSARQARALRRALRAVSPDVVVAFVDQVNVLTLLSTVGMALPVIVSERVDTSAHRIGVRWRCVRRLMYPRAAAIVVQTTRARDVLAPRLRRLARVIPNPVSPPPDAPRDASVPTGTKVVAMGRLVPQKGFDLLLRAFARIEARLPACRLEIWGDGPERTTLEGLARELGLTDRVTLPGRTEHPAEVMRAADLFVLSSRYEGFPNVLCEALALGLATISFDCRSGPSEIVRHGVDGVLVPAEDVEALAVEMERLIDDADERARLGDASPSIIDRLGLEQIAGRWEALLDECAR